jgi:hypothetical protein
MPVIEDWELQQLRLVRDRRTAIRKLEELLVRRKGNDSEKHGIAFGLYPAWAYDEAKAMLEAAPPMEASLPMTRYQRQDIEAMVYKVFRRNADKPELTIARDIILDAEPAAQELGSGITAEMIIEFMYEHYPQLRPRGNPGRPYGVPKTEAERRATHQQRFGTSELPPRGTGMRARQPTIEELPRALQPREEAQRSSSLPGQELGGATPSAFPVQFYGMVMMFTNGFRSLSSDMQARIMDHAMKSIHPYDEEKRTGGPDFIVYDPQFPGPQRFEDQGRSIHVPAPQLSAKVYAKLDDYGSAEALSESMGQRTGARYTVTFMLAKEY